MDSKRLAPLVPLIEDGLDRSYDPNVWQVVGKFSTFTALAKRRYWWNGKVLVDAQNGERPDNSMLLELLDTDNYPWYPTRAVFLDDVYFTPDWVKPEEVKED